MEKMNFEKEWVKAQEVRKCFPMYSDNTFKVYLYHNKLPIKTIKIGGRHYVRRADLNKLLELTNNGKNWNVLNLMPVSR